jgi:hypothetical protein
MAQEESERRGRRYLLPVVYKDRRQPSSFDDLAYADFRQSYETGLQKLLSDLRYKE